MRPVLSTTSISISLAILSLPMGSNTNVLKAPAWHSGAPRGISWLSQRQGAIEKWSATETYMHMDLQAIVGEAVQIDMCGQGAVNEQALAHELLVILQDAIQLVKVLHAQASLLRQDAHRWHPQSSLPWQSPVAA